MKKYLSLVLVLCMVFALCVCGTGAEAAAEKQKIVVAFNDASDTGENGFTYKWIKADRKSTRLNSSHTDSSRMPSSA